MAYKHAEIMKAWLDGKTIQCQDYKGRWHDINTHVEQADYVPHFSNGQDYRIKPEPVVIKYKRYFRITAEGPSCVFTCAPDNERHIGPTPTSRVVWIDTEWQEYVVDGD